MLIWRSQWESSGRSQSETKVAYYNIEDCEALENCWFVVRLCQQTEATNSTDTDIVFTDLLKRESPHHHTICLLGLSAIKLRRSSIKAQLKKIY
jgi:hypothetical protein